MCEKIQLSGAMLLLVLAAACLAANPVCRQLCDDPICEADSSRSANPQHVLTSAPTRLRNAFSLSAQFIATTRKPHPTNVLLAKRNANHSFVSIAASRLSATFYAKRYRVVGTARSLKKENAKRRPVCGSVKGLSVKNLTVQKLESRA